jgi:hypothetical protein
MFKKIIVGLLKIIAGRIWLLIILRLSGLVIPVDKLEYQEVPDSYFAIIWTQALPDDQNQYIKFVEFMSGDYQRLISWYDDTISKKYQKLISTGDYIQANKFTNSNSWDIIKLANYYDINILPQLSWILFTGQWWAVDMSWQTIDTSISYIPLKIQQLVRDLNVIASWYCDEWYYDKCKSYQDFSLLVVEKQILANISMMWNLVWISNVKASLHNIIYLQSKNKWIKINTSQLHFINQMSYRRLVSSEYEILKNTVAYTNGNSCLSEDLIWVVEDMPNYRRGKLIDEEQFNWYIKYLLYSGSQCTTKWCFDELEQKVEDLSNNMTFWDKIRPALWPQHTQNFITRVLLIALPPRTSYEQYLTIEEIRDLRNSILSTQ